MDENNRNFFLAMALSVFVLVGWQYFYVTPKLEKEKAAAAKAEKLAQSRQQPKPEAGIPAIAADHTLPSTQNTTPAAGNNMSRSAALEVSQKRVPISTPGLKGSIALRGGRIDDLELIRYRKSVDPYSPSVVLFSPSGSPDPFYVEYGWSAPAGAGIKVPASDTMWTIEKGKNLTPDAPITIAWDNGEGITFRRTISVDENYMFSVTQEVSNNTDKDLSLSPYALISRHGAKQSNGMYILHEGLVGVFGNDGLQEVTYEDIAEDVLLNYKSQTGWLGITDKYWAATIIPAQGEKFSARFSTAETGFTRSYQADYLRSPVTVLAGSKARVDANLFAGAKKVRLIDTYEKALGIENFDLLIDWGWFYFITKPMFWALDWFYNLVGNFGVSILIVTLLIKIVLFPLANKSYVSMGRMKKLQPKMEEIKNSFPDDKTAQQQALMELYKREKVNPVSGCLPMLIQIPVFFALYKVLFVTIEMRHAPFFGWIQDLSAKDPTSIFNLFGLLPYDVPSILYIGIWPIIMGITMWVQMQLNPAQPDPVQRKIFAWMPVFFTVLLASFPAGLVIYWAWNNLLSVIQQWYIMSKEGVEIHLFANLGLEKYFATASEQSTALTGTGADNDNTEGGDSPGGIEGLCAGKADAADDLTMIKGIGPKLQKKLNSLGINSYRQIAGWSEQDIDMVDEHLRFSGRIQRDRWVEQATKLLEE
jgi:YidC/Oxa1 family membrane protein insertase